MEGANNNQETTATTLAVILEKMKHVAHDVSETKSDLQTFRTETKVDLQKFREELKKEYVTNKDIKILRAIVYGFAGLIMTAAGASIVRLIIPS